MKGLDASNPPLLLYNGSFTRKQTTDLRTHSILVYDAHNPWSVPHLPYYRPACALLACWRGFMASVAEVPEDRSVQGL